MEEIQGGAAAVGRDPWRVLQDAQLATFLPTPLAAVGRDPWRVLQALSWT